MERVIRTIYSMNLQTVLTRKLVFVTPKYSTLNEKFDVLANEANPGFEYPSLNYLTIGNGGVEVTNGVEQFIKRSPHLPTHASLYNHIPFVLRPENNDLTEDESKPYRLRTKISVNGNVYIAYYAKYIESFNYPPNMISLSRKDGSAITDFFIPTIDDLNPVPPSTPVDLTNEYTEFVAVADLMVFELSTTSDHGLNEVQELMDVFNILYGVGYDRPIITEIGICSGVETYNSKDNGDTYQEAKFVQLNYALDVDLSVSLALNTGESISKPIELGGMEPLIKL